MKIYDGILDLMGLFDVFIFDAFGVFWNGINLYSGVLKTFETLINEDKKVCILSNTTKVSAKQQEDYEKVGLIRDKHYNLLITSGEYTRYMLTNRKLSFSLNNRPARYFVLGKSNAKLFENVGYEETKNIENADCIYLSSASFTSEEYEKLALEEKKHMFQLKDSKDGSYRTDDFSILTRKIDNNLKGVKLPCFVANPDYSAIQKTTDGEKNLLTSGAMARYLMTKGYEVLEFGKPNKMIYDFLLSNFKNIDRNRVCMVGDTLKTDIKGANNSSIKSILCMKTGITANRIRDGEKLEDMIKTENVVIDYFIKRV